MSLNPAISVTQSRIAPQNVSLTDESTGIDVTITTRRLYIQDGNGDFIVPTGTTTDYIIWDYADPTITVTALTQDTAASITVLWLNGSDDTVYQYNSTYSLNQFGKQFFYYLIQTLGLTPATFQDANYSGNISLFWAMLRAGDNAITYGNDIFGAQECFNKEIFMMNNQAMYF